MEQGLLPNLKDLQGQSSCGSISHRKLYSNQNSWVHSQSKGQATAKAKDLVASAVGRARFLEEQEEMAVPVTRRALVIGGGVAGIEAALELAEQGHKVTLVEKQASIGGIMAQLDKTYPTMDCSI